jgi:predicted dehydrogenase
MKKAAVVGFGFMGMTHALNILRNKDLELKAIVDSNMDLFRKGIGIKSGNIDTGNFNSEQFENIAKYTGIDECLEKEEIDAFFICVHTGLHYEIAMKALSENKHVFLEKPFCLDILQAEEMINLAAERHKVLMVGHVVRFMQPYVILKQWIDHQEYGEPEFLYFNRFCGMPAWGQWKEKSIAKNSGGALFDLVIHDIDFASYALGIPDDIKSTSFPGKMSNHDYVSALWGYRNNNARVRIEGGNTFHSTFQFQAGYMAKFEKASVIFNTMKSNTIQVADENGIKEFPLADTADGYYDETAYFTGCIEKNMLPEKCTPQSSLESIKLCYRHIK